MKDKEKICELDIVLLKDGTQGTIVHVFTFPSLAYEFEPMGSYDETITISPSQIAQIVSHVMM